MNIDAVVKKVKPEIELRDGQKQAIEAIND